jgi:membrane-associated phospholipid phosphatase
MASLRTMHRYRRRGVRRPSGPGAACACVLLAALCLGDPAAALAQEPGSAGGAAPAGQADCPATVAVGQDAPQPANLRAHAVILAVGTATVATVGALQSRLAPSSCRWCDLNPDGTDGLNGLDRAARDALRWQHTSTPETISNVLAYAVAPAAAVGLDAWAAHSDGRGGDFKVDALVMGEAVVLAANAAELLKFATARQRPFAHARALGQPSDVPSGSSDNLSFPSGHTTFAFAVTVSAARVASTRRYRHAAWVWGVGLPTAAAVGYFRIAADRHYLTDVLASAGVGTAMGLIVPRLVFTGRTAGSGASARMTVQPVISRSLLGVSCTW